ncbi:MAG: hypothetical protein ABSG57_09575 [Candidatus Bathyarchaeia archaeon]
MAVRRDLRIRNRPVLLLLLPVVLVFWMVGWVLYYTGSEGGRHRAVSDTVRDDGVEVGVVLLEEETEVNS